ncbi:hypothetical protein CDAR_534631 [Caerostris darwini]|uniref:Uncharacterized protein n=1 Tax=Caerostris darwini TaxID=1538125 RepID=A0AAV4P6Z3_9ARAC|nr:hypothetical protein CDAR_534631 [Caerostris darwini]
MDDLGHSKKWYQKCLFILKLVDDAVTQMSDQKNILFYHIGADHNNPVTCERADHNNPVTCKSKQVTRGRPGPLQKLVPKVPGSTKRYQGM